MRTPHEYDIAIIGSGIAGMYAAWRLSHESSRHKIGIFEEADRIGGRLLTISSPLLHFNANVGAMRYVRSQALITSLCRHFQTKLGDPYNHLFDTRFYVLRGKRVLFSDNAINEALRQYSGSSITNAKSLYSLPPPEQGLDPAQLVQYAIAQCLGGIRIREEVHRDPECANCNPLEIETEFGQRARSHLPIRYSTFTPEDWIAICRYGEVGRTRLYRMSFWEVIRRGVSTEAMRLIRDGLGYLSIIGLWNASEAIPWFLRDFDVESGDILSINGGMARIVEVLAEDTKNTEKHLNTAVCQLRIREDGRIGIFNEEGVGSNEPMAIARKVILSLPAVPLKTLMIRSGLESRIPDDLRRDPVTSYSLAKMFVWFKEPWWIDEIGPCGKILSDLALRQLYFYSGTDDVCSSDLLPKSARPGGMMLAYTDEAFATYWSAMAETFQDDVKWIEKEFYTAAKSHEEACKGLESLRDRFGVSPRFLSCVVDHLTSIFPEKAQQIKTTAQFIAYRDWRVPPHFGGWHAWRAGIPAWTVRKNATKPMSDAPVFLCGEALSAEQGWIEGALRSTERMLIEQFGVRPASFGMLNQAIRDIRYESVESYVKY